VRDAQPSDIRSRAGSVKGESLRKVCSVAIAVSDSLAVSDPAASPRTAAVGSNAQCEQFNDANPDHQHGECYRIIVEPISPWMHGTPPRSRFISRTRRQMVQMAAELVGGPDFAAFPVERLGLALRIGPTRACYARANQWKQITNRLSTYISDRTSA